MATAESDEGDEAPCGRSRPRRAHTTRACPRAHPVAERAVDLVLKKLGRAGVRSRTANVPLPGGDLSNVDTAARELTRSRAGSADEETVRRLVAMYGTRSRVVLELAASTSGLGSRIVPAHPVLGAEILHAVRVEMAHTLIDVVVRRTALGAPGHPGEQVARACADLLKTELGWSGTRTASELEALRAFYAPVE